MPRTRTRAALFAHRLAAVALVCCLTAVSPLSALPPSLCLLTGPAVPAEGESDPAPAEETENLFDKARPSGHARRSGRAHPPLHPGPAGVSALCPPLHPEPKPSPLPSPASGPARRTDLSAPLRC